MANKIQIKRGNKSNLPILDSGEFGYVKDLQEVYIGTGSTNIRILTEDDIYTDSDVDSHLSGGTGINYDSGIISTDDSEINHDSLNNTHNLTSDLEPEWGKISDKPTEFPPEDHVHITWKYANSEMTLNAFEGVISYTGDNGFTVYLPSNPENGDIVGFTDLAGSWSTNNLIIDGNGNTVFNELTFTADIDNIAFYLIYSNGNWTFVYDTSFKWEIESELDPGTYYTKFEINEKFEEIDGGEL